MSPCRCRSTCRCPQCPFTAASPSSSAHAVRDGVRHRFWTLVDAAGLVAAAIAGDFSNRIRLDNKQGHLKYLGEGINSLMDTCEVSLNDVVRVLAALAQGDLTEKIEGDYKGTWGVMKDDANATVDKLAEIVSSIKGSTESIATASKEIASGNSDLSGRTEQIGRAHV